MFSYGPPHMAEQKQSDQLKPTYSSSVRIQEVALSEVMNDRERWWERVRDIHAGGTTRWWWCLWLWVSCFTHSSDNIWSYINSTREQVRTINLYNTAIWMHYMDANKTAGEETRWQLHKNAACNPEQVLAATPHKTPTVRPPAPYHENYSS